MKKTFCILLTFTSLSAFASTDSTCQVHGKLGIGESHRRINRTYENITFETCAKKAKATKKYHEQVMLKYETNGIASYGSVEPVNSNVRGNGPYKIVTRTADNFQYFIVY